jgi:4-hydroxy-tetrahydrodipicolinate synthase
MTSTYRPLKGSIPALVTPMLEDGSVDYDTLRKLIDWHIAEGTDAIGVVGTTGESPTVNVEEHCEIIRVSVEQAKARSVPIMAGCGANSTAEAIELTRNSPRTSAPIAICRSFPTTTSRPRKASTSTSRPSPRPPVELPIILYNVPGRTVADMLHDTVLRLAQVPGIVGIKEATGNIERAQWLVREVRRPVSRCIQRR